MKAVATPLASASAAHACAVSTEPRKTQLLALPPGVGGSEKMAFKPEIVAHAGKSDAFRETVGGPSGAPSGRSNSGKMGKSGMSQPAL